MSKQSRNSLSPEFVRAGQRARNAAKRLKRKTVVYIYQDKDSGIEIPLVAVVRNSVANVPYSEYMNWTRALNKACQNRMTIRN